MPINARTAFLLGPKLPGARPYRFGAATLKEISQRLCERFPGPGQAQCNPSSNSTLLIFTVALLDGRVEECIARAWMRPMRAARLRTTQTPRPASFTRSPHRRKQLSIYSRLGTSPFPATNRILTKSRKVISLRYTTVFARVDFG